jgi:hypothetical protein
MVLMMAKQEAGPCEKKELNSRATFPEDAQMRVGKQLLAAKNLTGKWKSDRGLFQHNSLCQFYRRLFIPV